MITLLTAYLATGIVLLAGALAFAVFVRWGGPGLAARADRFLTWGQAILLGALLLPLALIGGGVSRASRPPLEIWSGPALAGAVASGERVQLRVRMGETRAASVQSLSVGRGVMEVGLGLLLLGALVAGGRRLLVQRRLREFCRTLPVVKQVGQVVLAAGPDQCGPFVARVRGRAFVVVPTSLLADPRRLAMVLAHEGHHLRRGHLGMARLLAALETLYFWNPALAIWRRALGELEDLACDRRVLGRARVSPLEYGRCLLWAAARAAQPAAHSMAASARQTLARRMTMLEENGGTRGRRSAARPALLAAAAATVILGATVIVHAAVGTPQVTAGQVAALGQRIAARGGFPVIADARIAEALNRRLNQPEWRKGMKEGLARMPRYRATIEGTLKESGLPRELLAMVMSESRFDETARTSRPAPSRSMGLWQLMPATARRMGLTVSAERDDRLDPALSTAAAARYLTGLFAQFRDWPVAISAYNGGEHLIARLHGTASIDETRERLLNTEAEYGRYLVSVMISLLVIEDPSLLD